MERMWLFMKLLLLSAMTTGILLHSAGQAQAFDYVLRNKTNHKILVLAKCAKSTNRYKDISREYSIWVLPGRTITFKCDKGKCPIWYKVLHILDNCDSYHSESMKWDEAFLIKEWNCDNKLWACCRGDVSINWGDRAN